MIVIDVSTVFGHPIQLRRERAEGFSRAGSLL